MATCLLQRGAAQLASQTWPGGSWLGAALSRPSQRSCFSWPLKHGSLSWRLMARRGSEPAFLAQLLQLASQTWLALMAAHGLARLLAGLLSTAASAGLSNMARRLMAWRGSEPAFLAQLLQLASQAWLGGSWLGAAVSRPSQHSCCSWLLNHSSLSWRLMARRGCEPAFSTQLLQLASQTWHGTCLLQRGAAT